MRKFRIPQKTANIMKILICIPLFVLIFFLVCSPNMFSQKSKGSVERQKKIVNQNCVSYEGQNSVYAGINSLVDEPKSVTEKNFTKYILQNYPNGFPKTGIVLYVVFQPNLAPCCRLTSVADSLKMDTKQVDFLTDLIIKYHVFRKVQFNKEEKIKYLSIMMGRYKKGELDVGFF